MMITQTCLERLLLQRQMIIFSKVPSEEFELTANSLGAQSETHGGLILRTIIYLTVNSQDDSHCELAVSFP